MLDAYPAPGQYAKTEDAYIGGMQAVMRFVAEHPDSWRTLFCSNPGPDVAELFARGRRRVVEQFAVLVAPDLERWNTTDAKRKTPVLADIFISIAESAVRSLLDPGNTFTPDELGALTGRVAYAAIRNA